MDRYLAGKPEWGKTRTVLQSDPQGLGQAMIIPAYFEPPVRC